MDKIEKQIIEQVVTSIKELLRGNIQEPLAIDACPESLRELVDEVNELVYSISEIWDFIIPLSQGKLNIDPPKAKNLLASPFKELHSQLRNLIWQVQQIAQGDYQQRVYFMGEFSESFNQMAEVLEEKERLIQEHFEYLGKEARILRENEARYLAALKNSPGGIYIFDPVTFKIIESNEKFNEIMGYDPNELKELTVYDLYEDKYEAEEDIKSIIGKSLHSIINRWYRKKNGDKVIFDINTCWFVTGVSSVIIVGLQDVTERNKAQETMSFLASHDSLTRVPNRFALEEMYKKFIESNKDKEGIIGAAILVDIDHFKFINDTFGHNVGDMVLINLVSIIKENLQDRDIIGRLGGDEFVIILDKVSHTEANYIAERLRKSVEKAKFCPINFEMPISYTVSIGVTPIRNPAPNFQELISQADYALYKSKEEGRNRVSLISDELSAKDKASETNELMLLISEAIEENRFILHFQPITNILTGKVIHHEALMRIMTDAGKMVYPGKAIPLAERFGLMPDIDRLIVKLAFEALEKYPELKIFVNLSGISIGDEELRLYIEENIEQRRIQPSRLGFEVTETIAVKDLSRADRWIRRLKEKGCLFALDDFGIGCSSFSYLQYLSVDYVKIDGSYIKDLDTNIEDRALVQAMYTVASSLGKEVIAEFVENKSIAELLSGMNVRYGQGYFLGRPAPVPLFI